MDCATRMGVAVRNGVKAQVSKEVLVFEAGACIGLLVFSPTPLSQLRIPWR